MSQEREAPPCPFCARIATGPHLAQNGAAVAFEDAFPLHPGHTLVVPRVHVADLFDLSRSAQAEVWALVTDVREAIARQHSPAGFNVGLNAGPAAGQTVVHAHVHVIPRHTGDVADPRGGVRWVIPQRARYWEPPA